MPSVSDSRRDRWRHSDAAWLAVAMLLALALRWPLLRGPGFWPDLAQFATWSWMSIEEGLAKPYEFRPAAASPARWANYPPLYLLVLNGWGRLFPLVTGIPLDRDLILALNREQRTEAALDAVRFFKLPAVASDLLTMLLLWRCLRRRMSQADAIGGATWPRPGWPVLVAALYGLNPAVLYDSAVWGQVDSLHTLLMLLSLDAAARRRTAPMSFWAAAAVLTKPQSLLLAPLWAVCLLWRCDLRRCTRGFAAAAAAALLICGPYLLLGAAAGIWDSLLGAVGKYPVVHLNGFSAWFLLNPMTEPRLDALSALYRRDTTAWLAGLTPRAIGLMTLAVVAALVVWIIWRRRGRPPVLRWAACVLPLAFFLLPTQMHERYLFPAVALWAWACVPRVSWCVGWLLVSLTAFLNMAWAWPQRGVWDEIGGPMAGILFGDPLGQPAGVWCALALLALLVWMFSRGLRSRFT
ncbi:MAG: glycosyltransferase 87 family protein [Phycisphaerae bacterium]|nr:glycosyltransferase 87 family protein [Phycisphaerae bacterium]